MIRHYVKVAFRNMWKYKSQTLVSVAGLAVGFVCFAMATLWIRYEMTYDGFLKNADRIYCVSMPDVLSSHGTTRDSPDPLAEYLKSTFPEISNAIKLHVLDMYFFEYEYEGVRHKDNTLCVDSSFLGMFDVKIINGDMDFLIPESKKVAITRDKAIQLFGNESPVGKKINRIFGEYTIGAVVTDLPKQSNYSFDFLSVYVYTELKWGYGGGRWPHTHTLVEIAPGVDIESFKQKLYEHEISRMDTHIKNITLIPLTSVRYTDPNVKRDVRIQHIIIFAVAGSLLILCTLFNYLTLFVSRFRIRQRELALRVVYGASGQSLFAMLSVEFLMSLIAALILGLVLINIFSSPFLTVSGITGLKLSAIYLESVIYIAGVIVIALTSFFLTLALFKRRTLDSSIRNNRKILRKASIVVQLIISIVFAFCTIIILKQMYYLHNTDLGFAFKNRGSISLSSASGSLRIDDMKILNDKIKQIPEIEKFITGSCSLLPMRGNSLTKVQNWDNQPAGIESLDIECVTISEGYTKFYELKLVEGEFLNDTDEQKYVLINESAAKVFGWNKATGRTFDGYTVKGVIKNIYNLSPTIAAKPVVYKLLEPYYYIPDIQFKYTEGSWKICVEKISKIITEEFSNLSFSIYNSEVEYDKYLKSENILLAILTVVSLVCMTVCVFGFVSIVSLTCEERRKEIAIRKINGATIKDILDIFFKEHLTLLAVGALIAFPVGYIIMKGWLEQYVIQTEMSVWIYLSILLELMMVIVICVGGRVYKTSSENPVNALNK